VAVPRRSICTFHLFYDFQHLCDAVPVASGAGGFQQFLNRRPGQFRLADAIGPIFKECNGLVTSTICGAGMPCRL